MKALQGFTDPITYSKEKYKGIIKQLSIPKRGLIQGPMWSKRQDFSARSTITVDPDLNINWQLPREQMILKERDLSLPNFKDIPFENLCK